jgi:tetratricopeptide (TPR) repeat protein
MPYAVPAVAIQTDNNGPADAQAREIDRAWELVQHGKPADAIPIADKIIADFEANHAASGTLLFCARSTAETLLYSAMAASKKMSAQVLAEDSCYAYFLKGFALIELGRGDEAKPYLDKAITLAPMNSQFLGERGEWFKSRRDWGRAFADFETAASAAELSPEEMKSFDQRRAWRGLAFVRIEQGRLDDAEKLLRQCIDLDPSDAKAKRELEYIASLRRKSA